MKHFQLIETLPAQQKHIIHTSTWSGAQPKDRHTDLNSHQSSHHSLPDTTVTAQVLNCQETTELLSDEFFNWPGNIYIKRKRIAIPSQIRLVTAGNSSRASCSPKPKLLRGRRDRDSLSKMGEDELLTHTRHAHTHTRCGPLVCRRCRLFR